jgi:hypothetical protein
LTIVAAFVIGGCGSGSPTSSSSGALKLQGIVLQDASGVTAQSNRPVAGSGSTVTVTVKEVPSISVKVSGNGTFELEGLPTGTFTLVFTVNGVVVGEIQVQVVSGATEIKIVVQITGGTVILVNITFDNETDSDNNDASKTCIINGGKVAQGIELEGNVASGNSSSFKMDVNGNRSSGLVDVNASGASFSCNGQAKSSDCKASLAAGNKVHVRGTLTSCSTSAASVTATEVKVQK